MLTPGGPGSEQGSRGRRGVERPGRHRDGMGDRSFRAVPLAGPGPQQHQSGEKGAVPEPAALLTKQPERPSRVPELTEDSPQSPAPSPLTFRPCRLPSPPPRPFVLIPDSAAPAAAAAKRTLHFRFRFAPPLSQNPYASRLLAPPLSPFLPHPPSSNYHILPLHRTYNHAPAPPIPAPSPSRPVPCSSSPAHSPSRFSIPRFSSTSSLVSPLFFRPALASRLLRARHDGNWGGRGLAALQPRQAQSPPDKPLNRLFPRDGPGVFDHEHPV